jgi:hypothetical protein
VKQFSWIIFYAVLWAHLPVALTGAELQNHGTQLGIDGTRFTLNGKPVFLYGISYYGALGASRDYITEDLNDAQRHGFNWIRVWANWSSASTNVAAIDQNGEPRPGFLEKLKWLVEQCDSQGLVVDVTLTRGDGTKGSPHLETLPAHRRAVEVLVNTLGERRNWYLDLSNERNVRDKRFTSIEDIRELRAWARKLEPRLLVTASDGGDISKTELKAYVQTARLDFVAPHRPRDAASPAQTEPRTMEYLDWMKELGAAVPVHYQEPLRRGYAKWEPRAEDFVSDLRGALAGGAAGWCLHNGSDRNGGKRQRSFDLSRQRLFAQLDEEELKALNLLQILVSNGH